MNQLLKRLLTKWVIKNYPFAMTTEVFITTLVKKGKKKEWRTFTSKGERIYPPLISNEL